MKADLHCHTTASDGLHAPAEVLRMAEAAGVSLLALTDHDTVAGVLALLDDGGCGGACTLVPGIELSCQWRGQVLHVLGLYIDPRSPAIGDAVVAQLAVRDQRARRIGQELGRRGIAGAFEGALAIAGGAVPCRPHFARYLVERGHCRDAAAAFDRYLGRRHLKGIDRGWPELNCVVGWIVAAGGIAVLAHPDDYRFTRSKLGELVQAFQGAGGRAMELAAPGRPEASAVALERLCREYGLAASVGSDFHGVGAWRQVGRTRRVPEDLTAVWELV